MRGIFAGVAGATPLQSSNIRHLGSSVARWAAARREGLTFAALGVLALGVTLYLCAPGYMGPDSRSQFQQARSFEFWDDHPVLMALIWHYLDRLAPGPVGMLVFSNTLYWGGLAALFWVLPGRLVWRVLGFVLVGFFPPGFSTLPIVYKDSIMHGALLIALACVAAPTSRALAARLGLALVCFLLAIGVRHNAAAATWPFLALPIMRIPFVARLRHWRRLLVGSVAGLALAFGMARGMDGALAPLSHRTELWQMIPAYDLAGMSLQTGKLLVAPDSPVFTRGMRVREIRKLFRLDYGDALYNCVPFKKRGCVPLFRRTLDRGELAQLSQNWLSAIAEHPGAYLAHRWALTRKTLTVNTSGKELYWLSTAPHGPLAAQYPPPERLLAVLTFMERHIRSVVYAPWIYVVLGALILPFALRRFLKQAEPLPLLLLVSGAAYMLSTTIGTISSTYRYCVWTILCSVLALFALLVSQGSAGWSLRRLFARSAT